MTLTTKTTDSNGYYRTVETLADGRKFNTTYNIPVVKRISLYKDSVVTPGYHNWTKRKPRALPMNPFTYELVTYHPLKGWKLRSNISSTATIASTGSFEYSQFGAGLTLSSEEINSINKQLANKIRLKIKDQKVNLGQAYAERSQTAKLIANTAITIAGAFADLKRGNLLGAAESLGVASSIGVRKNKRWKREYKANPSKAAANRWLELQYGWKPLLNDIYGSAELLAQRSLEEVIDRATAQIKVERRTMTQFPNGGMTYREWKVLEYTRKQGVYFSTSSEVTRTLAQVGLSNPALIAWELLPYSFVVDWFIPIGSFISSIDATLGLTFRRGYDLVFMKQKIYREYSYKGYVVDTFQREAGVYDGLWERVWMQRSSISSFPQASYPEFKNPVSFDHVANAMALLTSTFKK